MPRTLVHQGINWFTAGERRLDQRRERVAQAVVSLAAAKLLRDAIEDDGRFTHSDLKNSNSSKERS